MADPSLGLRAFAPGPPPAFDAGRAQDEGLVDVVVTTVDSPVGPLLLAATDRGLVRLVFLADTREDEALARLAARISPRVLRDDTRLAEVAARVHAYLSGSSPDLDVAVDLRLASTFAHQVLAAARRIPAGEVRTYGQLAATVGSPRAARAVGRALGSNPVPIVVPCHRVVPASGGLGGYVGGTATKRRLLALEGAPVNVEA